MDTRVKEKKQRLEGARSEAAAGFMYYMLDTLLTEHVVKGRRRDTAQHLIDFAH